MEYTVFTTAYNRPDELRRLYASLLEQTYRDFTWLIVDDSTDDQVKDVVEGFIREGRIKVRYHKQEHRGRYWAQKTGFALVDTPYMVDIDDDDELTEDCLEVLAKEWERVEKEGRKEIGVICGLCVDDEGHVVSYHDERPFFDTNYIDLEWKQKRPSENLVSRKLEVIKNVDIFCDERNWLADQVTLVRESVLWNRVARKYNMRYVNHPIRIYHTESTNRLSTPVFDQQKCIDYVYSNGTLLNELRGRLWENPKDLVKYVAEYVACGAALHISFKELVAHLEGLTLKTIAILLYPAGFVVGKWLLRQGKDDS